MDLYKYQQEAMKFAAYDYHYYPILALAEEAGELIGLFAKQARGDSMTERFGSMEAFRVAIIKEAGDVLWQLTAIMEDMDISMEEVARINLEKLAARQTNGTIRGSGSDR